MKPRVSIVIRARNEERWISLCLDAVFSQKFKDFEVILVDNNSRDGTIKKTKQYPVKIVNYTGEYKPGKALNVGIINSKGKYLVFLSGHAIPVNSEWLENLISSFNNKEIAGVYGRQQPMSFSSPHDKRDLLITFGLDRRIQEKDSFFHNANSAIKRSIWEEIPFDETVTNIEDRIWANQVLLKGYKILYEPEASVFHYHGIHHDGARARASSTVKVIEEIEKKFNNNSFGKIDSEKLNIISLIPVKGGLLKYKDNPILSYTIEFSLQSDIINDTIVLTDNEEVASFALDNGAKIPFLRESDDSKDYVDLSMVYEKYLDKLEMEGIHADLIVSLEPTYVFRPDGLIPKMVALLLDKGYDSVVPIIKDYNWTWLRKDGIEKRVDFNIPRHLKDPLLISLKGLALVTHPEFLRKGKLLGDNCGLIEVDKMYSVLEIRKNTIKTLDSLADKLQKL